MNRKVLHDVLLRCPSRGWAKMAAEVVSTKKNKKPEQYKTAKTVAAVLGLPAAALLGMEAYNTARGRDPHMFPWESGKKLASEDRILHGITARCLERGLSKAAALEVFKKIALNEPSAGMGWMDRSVVDKAKDADDNTNRQPNLAFSTQSPLDTPHGDSELKELIRKYQERAKQRHGDGMPDTEPKYAQFVHSADALASSNQASLANNDVLDKGSKIMDAKNRPAVVAKGADQPSPLGKQFAAKPSPSLPLIGAMNAVAKQPSDNTAKEQQQRDANVQDFHDRVYGTKPGFFGKLFGAKPQPGVQSQHSIDNLERRSKLPPPATDGEENRWRKPNPETYARDMYGNSQSSLYK